ncbi:MAG: MlaD family protein [Planctomycetota bacterium]
MQEHTRNTIVGLTVVVALGLLGTLVVMFTGLPQVFQTGYTVRIRFDHSGGVRAGDAVHMSGMRVGQITDVRFVRPGRPDAGVVFTARIDEDIRLPGNTRPHMYTQGLAGQPYIALQTDGEPIVDPETGRAYDILPTDRVVTLPGTHAATNIAQEARDIGNRIKDFFSDARPAMEAAAKLGDLPDQAGPALRALTRLSENLNRFLAPDETPTTAAAPTTGPTAATRPAPATPLARVNRILEGMDGIFGDPEARQRMQRTLENLDRAAAEAVVSLKELRTLNDEAREMFTAVRGEIEQVSADSRTLINKLIGSAERLSKLLADFQKSAARIERGEGTVGRMLHDTELYDDLVTAAEQLTRSLEQLNQLLEKWKAEGVELKLK